MNIEFIEPSTALTVQHRAALALGSDKARTELAALVLKSAAIQEVKNQAGRDEAHGAAMTLVRARTGIQRVGKTAREDAAAFQKAVIAEENSLLAITSPEEKRLLALRDAWDKAIEDARKAKEDAERQRVMKIHMRIDAIKAFVHLAWECRTAAMVASLIDKLGDVTQIPSSFDEFGEEAVRVMRETRGRLVEIQEAKLADEAERERIKAEQAAENERLAVERAEFLIRQEEALQESVRLEALRKAEQEAERTRFAEERAEQSRLDKIASEAEKARLAKVREQLDRQRAEALARDKEAARLASIERERDRNEMNRQREADAAEMLRQRKLLADENARINAARAELERERVAALPKPEDLEPAREAAARFDEELNRQSEPVEPATYAPLRVVPDTPQYVITSDDLYCMGMESETADKLMPDLCHALSIPFPPMLNTKKTAKDVSRQSHQNFPNSNRNHHAQNL